MKNILVIGGAGYIGSHMSHLLQKSGYQPIIFDNLSTGHQQAIDSLPCVIGDLRDEVLLETVFESYEISAVMHFAALISVGESVEQPLMYYDNNVRSTLNLLAKMKKCNVDKLIFSSTAAVYGTPQYTPIDLNHPTEPINPYGSSKLMIEKILADCDGAYNLKSICLRYFNAAGGCPDEGLGERHEPETHLIPLACQVASGRRDSLMIYGDDYDTPDGTCVRDYVHVIDICQAHLIALERLLAGNSSATYNLGTGVGYSVQQIIDTVAAVVEQPINVQVTSRRQGDPARLVADPCAARSELGWQPSRSALADIIYDAWRWELQLVHEKLLIN